MSETIKKAKDSVQGADTLVRRGTDAFLVATDLPAAENGRKRYRLGGPQDFPDGSHRVVDVGGRQLGVFHIKGTLYALPNICPHMTGPVCEADILTGSLRAGEETDWKPEWVHDGEVIVCPWHGLEYHVPTGQCLAYEHIRIRRYKVTAEGDDVVVEI
jgi:nitrite reductase (NADH) small subunit